MKGLVFLVGLFREWRGRRWGWAGGGGYEEGIKRIYSCLCTHSSGTASTPLLPTLKNIFCLTYSVGSCSILLSDVNTNPFTATACKSSGLKDGRTTIRNSIANRENGCDTKYNGNNSLRDEYSSKQNSGQGKGCGSKPVHPVNTLFARSPCKHPVHPFTL